jgi:cold shock CspA family protein
VRWFAVGAGAGGISRGDGENVFFHVTAIPGEGYRNVKLGTPVSVEVAAGLVTRTVRAEKKMGRRP